MKRIEVATLRGLPRPTPEQQAGFVEHLSYAHSWYKHIPLVEGGEFVVYLSAEGERFARGVSRERYRQECGFLAYAWRLRTTDAFHVDDGEDVEFDPLILAATRISLQPYCSNDMAAIECLLALYGDDVPAHPHAEALRELFAAERATQRLWQELSGEIGELVISSEIEGKPLPDDARVERYARAQALRDDAYRRLRAGEVRKIGDAIDAAMRLAAP